ncbi:peroxisomal and mitochondrial division factor 2-like isoform X1 [Malania oleifera]|uniref:peroxisomal and mitochondrial division factor 2-like isoform X1 n=1 Tax=Malania oleifera TaxID=397392 RepID=UPI0025AE6F17|nr:peroxisomal and mitochondrial division factor 2-like isoform X1 [Malania oleifera]
MADENIHNGVASELEDRTVEIDGISSKDHDDHDSSQSEMIRKIEVLQHEKIELERENDEIKERMGNLTVEIEGLMNDKMEMREKLGKMEREIEQSESDKKAVEAIAARAFELETEVSRLQHDLISSMSEGEEANAEVVKLKSQLEEKVEEANAEVVKLKSQLEEKVAYLENLEKKQAGLCKEVEKVKAGLELAERKVRVERSERVRVEEEMKVKIEKKETETSELKRRIEELESVLAKNALELEKMFKEKMAETGTRDDILEAAKKENDKVPMLESKISMLMEELEESKGMVKELKEKVVGGINGVTMASGENTVGGDGMGSKLQWPTVAVSTGTVVAIAVVTYLRYAKRR